MLILKLTFNIVYYSPTFSCLSYFIPWQCGCLKLFWSKHVEETALLYYYCSFQGTFLQLSIKYYPGNKQIYNQTKYHLSIKYHNMFSYIVWCFLYVCSMTENLKHIAILITLTNQNHNKPNTNLINFGRPKSMGLPSKAVTASNICLKETQTFKTY